MKEAIFLDMSIWILEDMHIDTVLSYFYKCTIKYCKCDVLS